MLKNLTSHSFATFFRQRYITPINRTWQSGMTIVEVLLVMGIFAILSGIVTINLLNSKQAASINTSLNTFITDLKQQQLKAMVGDTGGRSTVDNYGVYFGSTTYTLFHGTAPQNDSSDLKITLGDSLQFSTGTNTFTGSQVVFLKGSGEVMNFSSTNNQIIIKDTSSNKQKTLTINRYGVVTSIN
jgi:prepilin-type N-terminal cleavage/methylation domain-containing protein